MSKLLYAYFSRLWKNKVFWGEVLMMNGFMCFVLLSNFADSQKHNISYSLDGFLFGTFMVIGIMAAVFTGMFLGTEYSDGTLRNKLAIGHSRTDLYLASFTVSFASSAIVCLSATATTLAIGIPCFGLSSKTPLQLLGLFGTGILAVAAFSGIFTMITMLVSNKTNAVVLCIAVFTLLLGGAMYVMMALEEPEVYGGFYEIGTSGVPQLGEPYPNPRYLRGTAREVFLFISDFLPTGQGFQLATPSTLPRLSLPLYSLFITFLTTTAGLFLFQRKDIK